MKKIMLTSSFLILTSCAHYHVARNAKLVSQSENIEKGESIGTVRGEDCQYHVLGFPMGEKPTVDKLLMDLKSKNPSMRYVNNMSVEPVLSNFVLFKKQCFILKGVAYK
jgi:hypothetical protein